MHITGGGPVTRRMKRARNPAVQCMCRVMPFSFHLEYVLDPPPALNHRSNALRSAPSFHSGSDVIQLALGNLCRRDVKNGAVVVAQGPDITTVFANLNKSIKKKPPALPAQYDARRLIFNQQVNFPIASCKDIDNADEETADQYEHQPCTQQQSETVK